MPLDYNNVKTPFYSEAEQTWAKPQDWTAGGVDDPGAEHPGRGHEQGRPDLRRVKDSSGKTAVVTHPDANAYRSTKWLTWKIPLSTFSDAGVKVTAVKTLYIGVGNRDAPTAGGAGKLYIDDIRVTKP